MVAPAVLPAPGPRYCVHGEETLLYEIGKGITRTRLKPCAP